MPKPVDRRSFLKTTTAAGAALPLVPGLSWRPRSSWEKLNIAAVGAGGKGRSDIGETGKNNNVVALCDVDLREAERTKKAHGGAKIYQDWRKMLEQKDIDAVTISTPDHMHAPVAMAAMALGKHVYVQKPLTHSVYEARQLLKMAKRQRVVTQMGNQHRSGAYMKGAHHLVRTGAIGAVREAHVWTNRPVWPQGIERPQGADPVPPQVDWDLWLGVAPFRRYKNDTYHRFKWRGFWDFGTGALGDMGCHLMDPVVYALQLPPPARFWAEGPPPHADSAPKWSIVTYEFPATTTQPALTLKWYDGGRMPPADLVKLPKGKKLPNNGALFIGEKATLFVRDGAGVWVIADDYFAGVQVTAVESKNHYQEWAEACKGNGTCISAFESSVPLTETVLLGNIAYRLGKKVEWDAVNLKCPGVPEADPLIRRAYRKGWEMEGL